MAIAFVAASTSTQPTTEEATASVTIPAHSSGDMLVVCIASTAIGANPATALSTPSGWTSVISAEAGNASSVRISSFIKTGNGSESSVSISVSSGTMCWWACCSAYSGVDTASPLDGTAGSNVQESGVDINSPSITTTVDGAWAIFAYVFDDDLSTNADHDSDAGFLGTSRGYGELTGGGNGLAAAMADYVKTTAGATGTNTWSSNGDSDAGAAITFALAPLSSVALLADDVESASSVTAPVFTGISGLLADDAQSTSEVTAPALVKNVDHLLHYEVDAATAEITVYNVDTSPYGPDDDFFVIKRLESASEVTAPAVTDVVSAVDLLANDVESASEVTAPAVTDVVSAVDLLANDVESASEVTAPAVTDVVSAVDLLANDVESASEVTAPVFIGISNFLANDAESTSEVTAPVVGQEHALLADDTESASEVTAPVLGQEHALVSTDAESAAEVTAPSLVSASSPSLRRARRAGRRITSPPTKEEIEDLRRLLREQLTNSHTNDPYDSKTILSAVNSIIQPTEAVDLIDEAQKIQNATLGLEQRLDLLLAHFVQKEVEAVRRDIVQSARIEIAKMREVRARNRRRRELAATALLVGASQPTPQMSPDQKKKMAASILLGG
jgi:hypothetical protein